MNGDGDVDMAATMAAAVMQGLPKTPPPALPPSIFRPGEFDDQTPFIPGRGASASTTRQAAPGGLQSTGSQADPMAQMMMMMMLTNLINALPVSMAAAVNANSNHRMANVKLEVKLAIKAGNENMPPDTPILTPLFSRNFRGLVIGCIETFDSESRRIF